VNESSLRTLILQILARWEKLPESDLLTRLTPVQLVSFRPELIRALAAEGLVELSEVGDERVIRITERGRQAAGASGSSYNVGQGPTARDTWAAVPPPERPG
jgi:hypothetical protein